MRSSILCPWHQMQSARIANIFAFFAPTAATSAPRCHCFGVCVCVSFDGMFFTHTAFATYWLLFGKFFHIHTISLVNIGELNFALADGNQCARVRLEASTNFRWRLSRPCSSNRCRCGKVASTCIHPNLHTPRTRAKQRHFGISESIKFINHTDEEFRNEFAAARNRSASRHNAGNIFMHFGFVSVAIYRNLPLTIAQMIIIAILLIIIVAALLKRIDWQIEYETFLIACTLCAWK